MVLPEHTTPLLPPEWKLVIIHLPRSLHPTSGTPWGQQPHLVLLGASNHEPAGWSVAICHGDGDDYADDDADGDGDEEAGVWPAKPT